MPWAAACLVGRWSPVWVRLWVAWARLVAHLVVPKVVVNQDRRVHNRAALLVDKAVQAVRKLEDRLVVRVARRVALRPDQHRALVDRGVPNKQVAQVVPAHRVADPAALRAVAPVVRVDKAAQVDWPWPHLAATTKCAVVSHPEPGRPLRVQLVSAVAHS